MIIFVGSKVSGDFVNEVAAKRDIEVCFIKENTDIKEQVGDILFITKEKGAPTHIIYDVDEYINDVTDILAEIGRISKFNNAIPVIATISINPGNILIREAIDSGIKNFVNLSGSNFDRKDSLEKILTGYFDSNEQKEIEEVKRVREEEKLFNESFSKIGIAGCSRRIGTTTQALQIAKFLQSKGYKVCYIESNDNVYKNNSEERRKNTCLSYVEKIKEYYEYPSENEDLGIITYEGLDLSYDPEKIALLQEEGYEYFVYDYGIYTDQNFNKTSFLKDDIKIFVCGSDIAELDDTLAAASHISYDCVKMIFSFTAKSEQDGVLLMFDEYHLKPERCYFAEYTPSAFILNDIEMYESLLQIKDKEIKKAEEPKKKKGFFRRKK